MTTMAGATIKVRVTSVLQKVTGGQKTVEASGSTVAEVFDDIETRHPGFKAQVYGPDGKPHRFVNIYLNDEDTATPAASMPPSRAATSSMCCPRLRAVARETARVVDTVTRWRGGRDGTL